MAGHFVTATVRERNAPKRGIKIFIWRHVTQEAKAPICPRIPANKRQGNKPFLMLRFVLATTKRQGFSRPTYEGCCRSRHCSPDSCQLSQIGFFSLLRHLRKLRRQMDRRKPESLSPILVVGRHDGPPHLLRPRLKSDLF